MTSKKKKKNFFLSYKLFYSELFARFMYYLSKFKKKLSKKKEITSAVNYIIVS